MPTTSGDSVSTVRAAVKLWIERCDLSSRRGGPRLGIACSGGADSMTLADAAIAELGGAAIYVLTIDHGLSANSAEVAAGVAAWAQSHGAHAVVRRVSVDPNVSVELGARDARYAALAELAREHALAWIWLAHTERDQAETVLMRILRGTGPAGLAGMPAIRAGECYFARPLLEVSRAHVDAYVAARQLPTWEDPMNRQMRFTRVRIREEVLPSLRRENPNLDEALVRLAASAREWTDALDDLAQPFAQFPIACSALAGQPLAIRKRALALALEASGVGFDAVHLDDINELLDRPGEGELGTDIPGARITRVYDELRLVRPKADTGRPNAGHEDTGRPNAVHALEAPDGYLLRTFQPGDRMRPARLKGRSRKLSDLYIDAKVPRADRATARVLVRVADGVIVWAEFLGSAFGESPNAVPLPR